MRKRTKLIALIVLVTPLLGTVFSLVTAYYAEPLTTNNDGIGDGKAFIVAGAVILGIVGLVASLILGPLVAHFTRKLNNHGLSLLGYVIPSLIPFLYVLWGFISVVVAGNPTPY
jgi:uncharacterized protein YacL